MADFPTEREFLRFLRNNYLRLFPRLLHQSEFNRRSRNLAGLLNQFRLWLVRQVGAPEAPGYLLDGTPIHVRHWRRCGPCSLRFEHAALSYCAAKRETYYGYKLVLLVTLDGRVLDFVLLPADADERVALDELLVKYWDLDVFGDKGFVDQPRQEMLRRRYGHRLWTPKRRNQKEQNPEVWEALCKSVCQRVETAISQAKLWFGLEKPRAKTLWGLQCRLIAKLTSMTFAAWVNCQQRRSPLTLANFQI